VVDNDYQGDVVDTAQTGRKRGLKPFAKGDPRAVAAGKKGAEALRARREASSSSGRQVVKVLDTLRDTARREDLGPNAAGVASWLLGRIVQGAIPVRNGGEAADLLRALVDVARLEAGESTSNTLVAHVGAGAAAEVIALRDQARRALGQGTDPAQSVG
jgi:hypothetical protein